MLKAYRYRIYPNKEQEIQLVKTFGCCRFVYNQTLAYRKDAYEKEKKSVSKTDCNNYCNRELKKVYEWLKEVDKFALTNAIYDMDNAYQKFFKEHAGYPKFKSKHSNRKSYTTNFTNGNITVDFDRERIKLPKLKRVKIKLHRKFSGQIKAATISKVPSGKYYVSVLVETEHSPLVKTNGKIGLDLGIKDLCITSDGKKYENPKTIKKYEKKLTKLQRQLANKTKGSRNYQKKRKQTALYYEKITNTRKDYLHKISSEIINENQVIVSENLQIKNMVKNHNLAKSISDVS
ncbi:RNA-guided endonuclease TnpB family protein, partial [Lachnoanaerobaculum saburreum]